MELTEEQKQRLLKWVHALESGEFKQARYSLRNRGTGGYCCLGVACEVYARETKNGYWAYDEFVISNADDGDEDILPETVADWFGLDNVDPVFNGTRAAQWNDDRGADFKKIAQLIREQYGLGDA